MLSRQAAGLMCAASLFATSSSAGQVNSNLCAIDRSVPQQFSNYLFQPPRTVLANAHNMLGWMLYARQQQNVSVFLRSQAMLEKQFYDVAVPLLRTRIASFGGAEVPEPLREAVNQLLSGVTLYDSVRSIFDGILRYEVARTPITTYQFYGRVDRSQVVQFRTPLGLPGSAWLVGDVLVPHPLHYWVTLYVPGSQGRKDVLTLHALSKSLSNILLAYVLHKAQRQVSEVPAWFIPTFENMAGDVLAHAVEAAFATALNTLRAEGAVDPNYSFYADPEWVNSSDDYMTLPAAHSNEIDVSDARIVDVQTCGAPSTNPILGLRADVVGSEIICSVFGKSGGDSEVFATFRQQFAALSYGGPKCSTMAIKVVVPQESRSFDVETGPPTYGGPVTAPILPAPVLAPPGLSPPGVPKLPPPPKLPEPPPLPKLPKICSPQDAQTDPECIPK